MRLELLLFERILAQKSNPTFTIGEQQLKLKPSKKALREEGDFKAELRIAVTDRDGERTVISNKIKVEE